MNFNITSFGRRILTIFIVTTIFLLTYAFSYSQLSAQAKALTPEADYYQVEPDYAGKEMFDNAKQKTKDISDNIVDKLNLDQPLPDPKKEFFNQVEDHIENVNGTQTGYQERQSFYSRDY